jgi:hypothetical protein
MNTNKAATTCQTGHNSFTMSNMRKLGTRGEMNVLLIPLILVVLILFGVGYFAYYSYTNMTNYRDHSDQISAAAVKAANQQLTETLQKQFAEEEKNPYKTYNGPSTFGSLHIKYPRTWSAYVSVNAQTDPMVNAYFYPDVVPDTGDSGNGTNATNFALRVEVTQSSYSDILQNFQAQEQDHSIAVRPYQLKKVPSVVGVVVTGQIQSQKTGTLIILPLRNQTLEIWTEGNQFQKDFENIILPNLTFSP